MQSVDLSRFEKYTWPWTYPTNVLKILPQFEPIWQNLTDILQKFLPQFGSILKFYSSDSPFIRTKQENCVFQNLKKLTCNVSWCTIEKMHFSTKNFKCHVESSMINLSKQNQITKDLFLFLGSISREKGPLLVGSSFRTNQMGIIHDFEVTQGDGMSGSVFFFFLCPNCIQHIQYHILVKANSLSPLFLKKIQLTYKLYGLVMYG